MLWTPLKREITSAPLLCKIHYDPSDGWDLVVLGVDASLDGWGATLGQYDDKGRLRVARYESGVWSTAERRYDATKRECRGVLKALQKLRFTLYGVHFILETDANVLVAQLNRAATDLPGALVTRWLAWIRLFDFEVRHVKGAKHTAADGLSRRPRTESDDIDEQDEVDVDDFIAAELDCMQISLIKEGEATMLDEDSFWTESHERWSRDRRLVSNHHSSEALEDSTTQNTPITIEVNAARRPEACNPLNDTYSEEYQRIAWFLTTLDKSKLTPRRPSDIPKKEYRKLTQDALNYSVRERTLWRNASKSYPFPRLVLGSKKERQQAVKLLHDELGHAGRETTYHKVATRYYWSNCYQYVRDYVESCPRCQLGRKGRLEESLFATEVATMFHTLSIDIVMLPNCRGYNSLLVCRDDFSGWPEAKPVRDATAEQVADFIWADIVCRHGVFGEMKVDGGTEFKGKVITRLAALGAGRIQISAYNSKANGGIERGHQPILNALIGLTDGGKKAWLPFLPTVLLAARTSIHGPTGLTPFYMVYGREAVLPIETLYPSWRTLGWEKVQHGDRGKLLELRARQFLMRDADIQEAVHRKNRKRKESAAYFDSTHRLRKGEITEGDLVLTYDVRLMDQDKSRKTKLLYRWLGPFRVKKANKLKGSYVLEEMDGTQVNRTYAGNRLKKFLTRDGKWDSEESDASAGQIDAADEPGSDAESGFRRIGGDDDSGQ